MEVAERVGLELALVGFVALDAGQSGDAVPLQAAMQGRTRQVWQRRLQRVEAIVERQQRVAQERHDDRLLLDREHGGFGVFKAGGQIRDGTALLPLGDGLLVGAVSGGQGPQARLTVLVQF